ncbi:HNH endonuclease [Neobacillus jeddahensis]|uniref:HNH endonuclease n=1 Tax=Neobacillus jeddahensis TaxID=1461580 RepID=UPI00058D0394|nr:HNH endonuclease [Neobacillus jeddahensis]
MNTYIVMQGHTYQQERELGIIWSPQQDQGGLVPHSWSRMKEIQKEDRVFHYVKGFIVAISVAAGPYQTVPKPTTVQYERNKNEAGNLVRVDYHELENPLQVKANLKEILPLLPIKYSAFQENGDGNSGYLYPCNEELSIKFLDLIRDLNIYQVDEEQLELSIDNVRRTEGNTLIPVMAETESELKTKMRIDHQKFRKTLMPLWRNQCAVCGIDLPELLRASHAKPWKDSTNDERLDPYNGVILCANHDALYDHGLIAFNGQGRLFISPLINPEDYEKYGLVPNTKIRLHQENKPYMKWHKKHIFNENYKEKES